MHNIPEYSKQGPNSSKRTRITRACDTCRRKKIKCDVDTNNPCTTCKQYNWECTFNDTSKKRGPPKGYIESLESRLERMERLLKNIGTDNSETITKKDDTAVEEKKAKEEAPKEVNTTKGKVIRYHGSSSGYYLVGSILSADNDTDRKEVYNLPPLANDEASFRIRRMNVDDNDLMVMRDATVDEETFADQEAIDDIMPRSVLEVLVHTYFKDAHTILPVVEKNEYMDAFEGRTTPPPAPLLTYAICAYSCFLLKQSDPAFKEAGVERDDIFQALLERTSTLVRKEYLKPHVVTIQALTLLCAHPTYSTSSYRNWLLAGMAVRMAQDLGLHRSVTTVKISKELSEKRKQLFYSTYVTDRWCSAVMGRPLAIADSDCDVDLPLVQGPDGNENLAMFVSFIKLSGILGEVLRRIYSPKAKANGYRTKAMKQTVWSLQKMLNEWFNHVPDDYKISEKDLQSIHLFSPESKKIVQGGPLTICYHAVVLLLHRPFIVLDIEGTNDDLVLKAIEICSYAAKLSIDIARAIPYMSIAKFGWNFSAYSVLQAALIHVYNCTSTNPDTAKEAKRYVAICINECFGPLGKDIPAGPPMIPFLQTISNLIQNEDRRNSEVNTNTTATNSTATAPILCQPFVQPEASYQQTMMASPMSVQQIISNPTPSYTDNTTQSIENSSSWLFNGNMPTLPQTTWQQLFSTAGASFTENPNGAFDVQGWDNFFMENQTNNMFMP